MTEDSVTQPRPILALVSDLFFTLKIGDTAKAVGVSVHFAGSADEFRHRFRQLHPALVIADLTGDGVDFTALFEELASEAQRSPVSILGYTTHADWKRTSPWHDRCTKVVTKDTLSRNLSGLIRQLMQQE